MLIAAGAVKGVGGAEGCPREGPARPAPRPPTRLVVTGAWEGPVGNPGEAHVAASGRILRSLSALVLRSDGPSRAMR